MVGLFGIPNEVFIPGTPTVACAFVKTYFHWEQWERWRRVTSMCECPKRVWTWELKFGPYEDTSADKRYKYTLLSQEEFRGRGCTLEPAL